MELELCIDCDEPTDRAGASDDSIYTSDGDGPFCIGCWEDGHAIDKRNARITSLKEALSSISEYASHRRTCALAHQHPELTTLRCTCGYDSASAATKGGD